MCFVSVSVNMFDQLFVYNNIFLYYIIHKEISSDVKIGAGGKRA